MVTKVESNSTVQSARTLPKGKSFSKILQNDPAPTETEEQYKKIWRGLGIFINRITPWLYEVGIWIFGGLIALNLLIQASLFTIGPDDSAVRVASAAFALVLPLDVTGLLLLRLIRELKDARFENALAKSFQDAGFVSDRIPALPDLEEMHKKRSVIVMRLASGILAVSILLTLMGMIAALWHMAWWIAVGFCGMVMAGFLIAFLSIASSSSAKRQEVKD